MSAVTSMLRIVIETAPHQTTLRLEGRLAGPWVEELARSWTAARAGGDAASIRVDLEGVTFIGAAGRALLRGIHEEGAVLVASGCMTGAIVDEITTPPKERQPLQPSAAVRGRASRR
ncbi:MAG: hypothetical protein ACREQ9_12930 [Candidatus Binatia bacterium]